MSNRNAGTVATRVNGGASGNSLVDLSSQLAPSNPKQLLEMLDRMGGEQNNAPSNAAHALTSAVVEEEPSVTPMTHSWMTRRTGGGGQAAWQAPTRAYNNQLALPQAPQTQSPPHTPQIVVSEAARRPVPSSSSAAKLSPVSDPPPAVLLPSGSVSPPLNAVAPPASPIVPYPAEDLAAVAAAGNTTATASANASLPALLSPTGASYADTGSHLYPPLLHSPNLPLSNLSRGTSGLLGPPVGTELSSAFYSSPFHGPLGAPSQPTGLDALLPLTPTHNALSAPPSPSPFAQ
jgi:hypothetical protein